MDQNKITSIVQKVIREVKKSGDAALVRLAKQHDKVSLSSATLRVPIKKIEEALKKISGEEKRALEACARRIQEFHWHEKKHLAQSWTNLKDGVRTGQIFSAVRAVGIYVPGGRFSYPSTLLMTDRR